MSMPPHGLPRVEIRRGTGQTIKLTLGCVVLVAGSVWMLLSADIVSKFVGVIGVAFFGGGGAYALWLGSRESTIVLGADAIELQSRMGTLPIPWHLVEDVGVTKLGRATQVGIRLREGEWEPWVASLPGEIHRNTRRMLGVAKPVMASLAVAQASQGDAAEGDPGGLMRASDLVSALKWARDACGYEVVIPKLSLDRSPDQFVELVNRYRVSSA